MPVAVRGPAARPQRAPTPWSTVSWPLACGEEADKRDHGRDMPLRFGARSKEAAVGLAQE